KSEETRAGRAGRAGKAGLARSRPSSLSRPSSPVRAMRHRVAYRKLGRVTEHRIAMLRNQATALLRYEHLTTTVPRAKELRPFVERLISIAKRATVNGGSSRGDGEAGSGRALHARRLVMHDVQDREVVAKLFDSLAPRFADRPGGYTRLLRVGYRKGDSAEL